MTEQIQPAGKSRRPGRGRRRMVGLLAAAFLIAGLCFLTPKWSREPPERRIAAVNASHALAPEENAATIYDGLVVAHVLAGDPDDPNLTSAGLAGLMEASRIESCWFLLSLGEQCYRDHVRRLSPMRDWARALAKAARADTIQGHFGPAAEKLRCLLRMADHLRQQALFIDFAMSGDIEARVWSCVRDLVIEPNASPDLLKMAEALPVELADKRPQAFKLILEVQPAVANSVLAEWGFWRRVQNWWRGLGERGEEEYLAVWYLRTLSHRRGVRALVGLRRYHDANGRWPDRLDQIRAFVPPEALLDPYTGQALVYRVTEDGFCLYARGPNRMDDQGVWVSGGADDQRIWPRPGPASRQTEAPK
jgi:hypothetical protein